MNNIEHEHDKIREKMHEMVHDHKHVRCILQKHVQILVHTCTLYGYVRVCTKLYTVQYIYNYDHAEELEAKMNMSMNFK